MFLQFIKIIIVCSFFAFTLSKVPPKLTGEHICHREENYTETVNSTSSSLSGAYSEGKEVSRFENVTKTRTIQFCCPGYEEEIQLDDKGVSTRICLSSLCAEKCINGNCTVETGKCECNDGFAGDACDEQCPPNFYGAKCKKLCKCGERDCHPITGKCLKLGEKILIVSMKSEPMMPMKNASDHQIEHNPYMLMNYSGEYGKQFNHYVKMGMNESGIEESVKKIVEYEVKKAEEEYGKQLDGYIILDLENEPVHPQFVTDHHEKMEHDEMVAMVTVACIIVGMLIFLLAVIYIKRATRLPPSSTDDAEFGKMAKKSKFSSIQNSPLPGTPRRPSLKKNKSVTFDDDSIDEVDQMNQRRTQSMPNALDINQPPSELHMCPPSLPKPSIMQLIEESAMRAPTAADTSAVYIVKPRPPPFNTFPRKKVSQKPSLERIYDRIYDEIPNVYQASDLREREEKTSAEKSPAVNN